MNSRDNLNLGDEIKNIVQNALNNKDFNKLNRDVENVVKGALNEVRKSVDWKPSNKNNNKNTYNNIQTQVNNKKNISLKSAKLTVPKGQVSGVLFTVFGIIGSTAFGIATFVLMLLGFTIKSSGLFHTIAIGILPFFILSIIFTIKGSSNRKRLKRFQRYISEMRGKNYCLINDLSSSTGLSNKAVEKDLRKMIDIGMFPEGHMDDKKTYFMLNNESYEQYLELKKNIAIKDLETSKQEENENRYDGLKPEIRKGIDEGRRFILEIKEANIKIPGEEISLKLERLEEITGKIFDYVEIHPEKFAEIKKFTEYFLPTTLKLVDAYRRLDYQSIQGVNISQAKKEIEETMDTINLAFENLLDDLFRDLAMDVSTDISVLETMFAQEGLTKKHMISKNKTMEDK